MTDDTDQIDATRRQALRLGGVGLAAGAALLGGAARATTQDPVSPRDGRADPDGAFAGRSIVITGGTSGMGEAAAYAFAREGASVAFCGRRTELGERNAATIRDFGGKALYVEADVRDEAQVEAFLAAAREVHGRIDVVHNNAGIYVDSGPTHESASSDLEEMFTTNVHGMYFTMKHAVRHMLDQDNPGGSIVNIASIVGHRGYPGSIAYSSSKAAVHQMTRVAAAEYGPRNVRINSVSPGPIRTPMIEEAARDAGFENTDAIGAMTNIGRIGEPEEVVRTVMWLASPGASNVVGVDVPVGGGSLLR